jgi:hypothetical protein
MPNCRFKRDCQLLASFARFGSFCAAVVSRLTWRSAAANSRASLASVHKCLALRLEVVAFGALLVFFPRVHAHILSFISHAPKPSVEPSPNGGLLWLFSVALSVIVAPSWPLGSA